MTRAIVSREFGMGNLRAEDWPAEQLGKDDVRVALKVVALNYRDVLVVQGSYDRGLALPLIPCSDGAGVVVEIGEDVIDLEVGQRVCTHMMPEWQDGRLEPHMRLTTLGGPANGVLCEERVLPRSAVARLPESVSLEEAACLPVAGLAAWSALKTAADIGPLNRVLLLGTGGVSIMALPIAKQLGAEVAITSSSDGKLERARELGADFTTNYRRDRWAEKVRDWSEGGVDLVLEIGGDGTFDQSVRATRDGGCIALLGVLSHREKPVNLTELMMRHIRVQGVFVGSHVELENLISFVDRNGIRPAIDRRFDGLEASRQAFAYLLSGAHFGKVMVDVSD